jgi:uncharacterized protein YbaP (TraB family)
MRGGREVGSVLGPEANAELQAYLKKRGFDASELLTMKPWFLAMVIMQLELQQAGYDVSGGVDHIFIERARGVRPIRGLETMDSQFQAMDRLPPSLQELMLRDGLSRVDRLAEDTQELIDAWRAGDDEKLEKLVFKPMQENEDLKAFYDLVFFRRNEIMALGIEDLARQPGTRFVVVGAGHLVGDRSVPAALARKGWKVERIRTASQVRRAR